MEKLTNMMAILLMDSLRVMEPILGPTRKSTPVNSQPTKCMASVKLCGPTTHPTRVNMKMDVCMVKVNLPTRTETNILALLRMT